MKNPRTFCLSKSESEEKCQVCYQPGHGVHFGVFACRACAAFFRRSHFSPEHKACRNSKNKCAPNQYGKWLCKKCRFEKCLKIGMTTENIQYDRDSFNSSETFAMKKALEKGITCSVEVPTTVESVLGMSHLIIFLNFSGNNKSLPYMDTSQLVAKAISIVLTPNLVRKTNNMSNLEQLTQGIQQSQFIQKEDVSLKECISQEDHKYEWERSICQTAKWMSCSDQIKQYNEKTKISILQSIWFIWGRLERMAITARMRMRNLCGKTQFVVSPESVIDYNRMKSDISHVSNINFEEMKFFFSPRELYYNDIICDMMEVEPDDMELAYIISLICFQVTGAHFGGQIEEDMERLQDILSNDSHEYYIANRKVNYLLRLKQLMRIKENFQKHRNIRLEKYSIGGVFNLFNHRFSNPEFFWVPPQKYV